MTTVPHLFLIQRHFRHCSKHLERRFQCCLQRCGPLLPFAEAPNKHTVCGSGRLFTKGCKTAHVPLPPKVHLKYLHWHW